MTSNKCCTEPPTLFLSSSSRSVPAPHLRLPLQASNQHNNWGICSLWLIDFNVTGAAPPPALFSKQFSSLFADLFFLTQRSSPSNSSTEQTLYCELLPETTSPWVWVCICESGVFSTCNHWLSLWWQVACSSKHGICMLHIFCRTVFKGSEFSTARERCIFTGEFTLGAVCDYKWFININSQFHLLCVKPVYNFNFSLNDTVEQTSNIFFQALTTKLTKVKCCTSCFTKQWAFWAG